MGSQAVKELQEALARGAPPTTDANDTEAPVVAASLATQDEVGETRPIATGTLAEIALPATKRPGNTMADDVKAMMTGKLRVPRPVMNPSETEELLKAKPTDPKSVQDLKKMMSGFTLVADDDRPVGFLNALASKGRKFIEGNEVTKKTANLLGAPTFKEASVDVARNIFDNLESAPVKTITDVISMGEHGVVDVVNKLRGKPKKNFTDNLWTDTVMDALHVKDIPENQMTQPWLQGGFGLTDKQGAVVLAHAAGFGLSMLTDPFMIFSVGAKGALKIGQLGKEVVSLTDKGRSIRNAIIRSAGESKILEETGKVGKELSNLEKNNIISGLAQKTDADLLGMFSRYREGVSEIESFGDIQGSTKKASREIFGLAGIKFQGNNVLTGDRVVESMAPVAKMFKTMTEKYPAIEKAVSTIADPVKKAYETTKQTLDAAIVAPLGKIFIPGFRLSDEAKAIKNLWLDTKAIGIAQETPAKQMMAEYFKDLNSTQRKDFQESMLAVTDLPEKVAVKSLSGDVAVQKILDEFTKEGGLSEHMAQWSGLFGEDPRKVKNWIPKILAGLTEEHLRLPKEITASFGPAERKFLSKRTGTGSKDIMMDPVQALSTRMIQISYANLEDKMWDKITKEGIGGIVPFEKIPPGKHNEYVLIRPPFAKDMLGTEDLLTARQRAKSYYAPRDVAAQYNEMATPLVSWPVWDAITRSYKIGQTVIHPAYHFGNVEANTVLNFLNIGGTALSPKAHLRALQAVSGKNLNTIIKTDLGEAITTGAIFEEAKSLGLVDHIAFDLGGRKLDPNDRKMWQGLLANINPVQAGGYFANLMDNQAKIVNYTYWRQRGLSPKVAAAEAQEALYNFKDLTRSEQYLNKFIMYYPFKRKNLEKQLKNPRQVAQMGKFFREFAPTDEQYDGMPDQSRKQFAIGTSNMYLTGLRLPPEDPIALFSAAAGGVSSFMKEMLMQSHPVVKGAVEIIAQKDLWSGRDLRDINNANEFKKVVSLANMGVPSAIFLRDFLKLQEDRSNPEKLVGDPDRLHILRNSPFARTNSYLGLMEKDDMAGWQKAIRVVTGWTVASYDEEKQNVIGQKKAHNKAMDMMVKRNIGREYYGKLVVDDKGLSDEMNGLLKQIKESSSQEERDDLLLEVENLTKGYQNEEVKQ